MNSYIRRISFLVVFILSSTVFGLTFSRDCSSALESLRAPPNALRSLASVEKLKIISYNLENFRVTKDTTHPARANRRGVKNKSPDLVSKQKALIENWDADILTTEEVFDEKSLQALVSNRYAPVFIEGNDKERHIAFAIKKDLPFYASIETHQDDTWVDKTDGKRKTLFSRDLPVLLLRTDPSQDPVHIIIGAHGKSRRDRYRDRNSQALRTAQYERAAQIVEEYKKKYPHAGILMAGDFNADTRTARELDPVKASLKDPFDLKNIPFSDRVTHIYFPSYGGPQKTQMDNIFVSPNLANQILSVRVIPYIDENGQPKPLPSSYDEREENGSDHKAVELIISTRQQTP